MEFDAVGIDVGSKGGMIDLRRGVTDVTALHDALFRLRETSAFQDNTFEGCNLADPQIHAVGEGLCSTPSVTAVPWLWPTQSAG